MRKVLSTVAAAMLVGATTLSAQNGTDEAAYIAIESTPLGMPARLSAPMMHQNSKMTVAVNYGYLGFEGRDALNNYGAHVEMPWRSSRVGVTLGYGSPACAVDPCEDGYIQFGANWGRRVTSITTGQGTDAARLTIGMDADVNYGKPTDASALAASVALPIAFVPQTARGKVQFVPFITPRFALGRYRTEFGGDTGSQLMLGGGFAVNGLMQNLGLNVGFNKVLVDGAYTQYGLGVTWHQR
jgi:hypothetical protein